MFQHWTHHQSQPKRTTMLSLEERRLPESSITLTLAKNCSYLPFILSLGRDHISGERFFQDSLLHQQQGRLRSRFNGTTQKAEAKEPAECTLKKKQRMFMLAKCSYQNRVAACRLLGDNGPCHLLTIKLCTEIN